MQGHGGYYLQRNPAIDILRALTVCLMIFVNDLWTIHGVPHWLGHARTAEDFLGLADFVYPSFLFVMGMSIPYSIERRISKGEDAPAILLHIFKRGFSLILMGVLMVNEGAGLNIGPHSEALYPMIMVLGIFLLWNDYGPRAGFLLRTLLRIVGAAVLAWMVLRFRTPQGTMMQARWWGILGLIGWAYLACALIYFVARDSLKVLIPSWLFFLLLCLLFTSTRTGSPVLDLGRGNFIDNLRESLHFGNGSDHALAMGGVLLTVIGARFEQSGKLARGIAAGLGAGVLLAGVGVLSHQGFIASKNLATLPWVLWSTALCVVVYTLLIILVRHRLTGWSRLLDPVAKAPLTAYLIPEFLIGFCSLTGLNFWDRFSGLVGILYCLAYVALVVAITWLLGKIPVKLKL